MSFKGKRVVLTGAGGGIGQATAKALLDCEATVHLLDVNEEKLFTMAERYKNYSDQIHCHCVDLSHSGALTGCLNQLNRVDYLVHSAGLMRGGSLLDQAEAEFEQLVNLNLNAGFYLLQQVGRKMEAQKQGAIVVIGSNAGTTPRLNMGGYGAVKAGLHMLVKNFALELSQYGVRCNIVSPGSTRTKMLEQTWNDDYGEEETIAGDPAQYRLGIPLQKIAEPNDIAQAVMFLLSDAASHITMHDLRIDGGATLGQL